MDVKLDLLSPRFSSSYNLVKANLTSTSFPNLDLLAVQPIDASGSGIGGEAVSTLGDCGNDHNTQSPRVDVAQLGLALSLEYYINPPYQRLLVDNRHHFLLQVYPTLSI